MSRVVGHHLRGLGNRAGVGDSADLESDEPLPTGRDDFREVACCAPSTGDDPKNLEISLSGVAKTEGVACIVTLLHIAEIVLNGIDDQSRSGTGVTNRFLRGDIGDQDRRQ